jgi:hypothetical protein
VINKWGDYYHHLQRWQAARDTERLRLQELFNEAWACQETDAYRSFATFTRGRDEAVRLGEPWWDLFFDGWRLNALTSFAADFSAAFPVAMELMVRLNSPAVHSHPWRYAILTNVLYTHVSVDPTGYQTEIEQGFDYLDGQLPTGSDSDRLVLNHRRVLYLSSTERYAEAYDLALRSLSLADELPHNQCWHGAWMLREVCDLCDSLGKRDLLAGYAGHMAELARQHLQLRRALASAWCWLAVAERGAGNEARASRYFHQGVAVLAGLERSASIAANPIARYHELAGDFRAAVGVRDRQLADAVRRGAWHSVCLLHVERCQLLAKAGELTAVDLATARQAAGSLRAPEWYLRKLAQIDGPPASGE